MEPQEAFEQWRKARRGKTGRALTGTSPERYEQDVADWLDHCHARGFNPLGADTADIVHWARTRPGPDGKPSTSTHSYERRLSAVLAFYAWCAEHHLVLGLPDLRAHRTGTYDGIPGLYKPTPAEREALSEAVAEWTGGQRAPQPERDQLLVRLMLWGLRPRQIVALDIQDVHDHGTHMTVDLLYPAGDGIDRHQPTPPTVARAITRYLPHRRGPADTGPLITSRTGRRLDPNQTLPTVLRNIAATHPTLAPIVQRLTPDGVAASTPGRPRRHTR